MQFFNDFLWWYRNKDVVSTLECPQKVLALPHTKGFDMLKLGFTLSNLTNKCLHSSTGAKFYPFTKSSKNLFSKFREDMVAGPSIVFTGKGVVDDTHVFSSTNFCKTIFGIDASQLCPYSMCHPMLMDKTLVRRRNAKIPTLSEQIWRF